MLSVMNRFVGATSSKWSQVETNAAAKGTPEWILKVLIPILEILDTLLIPIIILLGVAGMVYAIVLGVQYAKAESADKRDEAKKRLINAVIGVVIMLVALIGMKLFITNAPSIFQWVEDSSTKTQS